MDISRYEKILGNKPDRLVIYINNSIRAFKEYQKDFSKLENLEELDNLIHRNTMNIYYVRADRLKEMIEGYRALFVSGKNPEKLRNQREQILEEFNNIIAGLMALLNS